MTGSPVVKAASAGAARRLVQSAVVFLVVAASSAAALFGAMLLTNIDEGVIAGCANARCADLAVTINASRVTAARLARTRRLPGVTRVAGPYPQATVTVATGNAAQRPSSHATAGGGLPPQQITVVGRASPDIPLEPIDANPPIMDGAITHGRSRWPARSGEISLALASNIRLPLDARLTVTSAPGRPTLTLVGYGDQPPVGYEDAWVVPSQIPGLRATGAPAQEQMLYDFASAGTAAQISTDLAELKHALPAGAVAGSQSWLAQTNSQENSENTPFAVAFAVLALVLAVLIVANVVSAAVIASYRRIGVLKSIGFTPAQVTAAYLAQIGFPALAGTVAGTILGGYWVLPVIGDLPGSGGRLSVPLALDIAVPLGMLALTGLAAAVPAIRAGRLPAVAAIAAGQAPRAGRGYRPHRLASKLALPRPVTIGLAAPFARPARSAVTLAALTFGLAGVVLAAGLYGSIHAINRSSRDGLGQLSAGYRGNGGEATLTPGQNAKILAALRAQPGTARYAAEADLGSPVSAAEFAKIEASNVPEPPNSEVKVSVTGRPGLTLETYAYQGDSSWLGWNLISGRWYHGPHQADANSVLLAATGKTVGGTLTLTVNHKPVTVRIAGQVFSPTGLPTLFTSWGALGGTAAGLAASHYDIAVKPGTTTSAYIGALTRALGHGSIVYPPLGDSAAVALVTSYFRLLALLVAVLAALGVLNSVLMATRERVHDLGVFKAIGMTPRQTITMVTCWVVAPTIAAAAIGVPAGLIIQDLLIQHLAAQAGMVLLPAKFVHVLSATDLALLALAGLGIAIAGTLGPASWAAGSRATTALHAE